MTPFRTPPSTPPAQWNKSSLQSSTLSQGSLSSPPPSQQPQHQSPSNPPPRPVLPNYSAEMDQIRQECGAIIAEKNTIFDKSYGRRKFDKAGIGKS